MLEPVGYLDKLSVRWNNERLDLLNDLIVESKLGISDILPGEPFRDCFNWLIQYLGN